MLPQASEAPLPKAVQTATAGEAALAATPQACEGAAQAEACSIAFGLSGITTLIAYCIARINYLSM